MPFPSLISRNGITFLFCFLHAAIAQTVPGASFFAGNGAPGAGAYALVDDYEPSVFFNKFYFDNVSVRTAVGIEGYV